ncbi:MAG TPA: 6,7-dimethyl-8-ribityllumazine synthase [Candidatus Binatia bacterium]|nr:6,7-dimethyl-8-ribityllumazine synthase [Candidatus Binatia bacterium]
MLTRVKRSKVGANYSRFAIVASKYNSEYVDAMVSAAEKTLVDAKASVRVVRVPGAFEIPAVTARLARRKSSRFSAIICLGVILRGETTHAQHIGEAVSHALANIQVETEVPIIHEVLLLENRQQAEVRCLGKDHNRGLEAAHTALEMARIMMSL